MNRTAQELVIDTLRRINESWQTGRIEQLEALVHPDIALVPPGFGATVQGSEKFVAGHREFYESSTIHEFKEHDHRVDVAGQTAVATYRYEMDYERSGQRFRSIGRDLWVFELRDGHCLAVWRTLLDVADTPL